MNECADLQVASLGLANDGLAQKSQVLSVELASLQEEMGRRNEELEKATAKVAAAEASASKANAKYTEITTKAIAIGGQGN